MIPYLQTTPFTTAASSLLAILHYFHREVELSKENEFTIWKATVNLPTRASSIYALALYAKRKGLQPKIIVEKKEYNFPDYRFYRYTKKEIEQAAFSEELHYQQAEKENIPIKERKITFNDVVNYLKQENIVLLRLNAKPIRKEKRNTSNFIVVHGRTNDYFHLLDPILGALSLSREVMKEAFDSLESKKYRNNRMIIFPKR